MSSARDTLAAMAERCAVDGSRLTYAERLSCERAVFVSAQDIARTACGFELQGFSASARLDFELHCRSTSKSGFECEIVRLGFSIVAIAKLVCSGNPYAIEGLADPLAEGRTTTMAMLGRELKRYCNKLELYERSKLIC